MFAVTLGSVGGASTTLANQVLAVAQAAAAYWDRYIHTGSSVIEIKVDIVTLGGSTLAQAGTDYFYANSSGGFDYYEPATVIEARTGVDRNGADPDIPIEVDSQTLTTGQFFLGPLVDGVSAGGAGFDLWTVLVHEIAHGLGLLTFLDQAGTDRTSFDRYVTQSGATRYFNGPDPNFGPIALDESIAHLNSSVSSVLNSSIASGYAQYLTALDVSIFGDLGFTLRRPTSGNDVLSGFGNASTSTSFNPAMHGLDGDDSIIGLPTRDDLHGDGGNDTLYGGRGEDLLQGGDGDDWLRGSADPDGHYGGGGFDTIDYSAATEAVIVSFGSQGSGPTGGYSIGDTYDSIEQIIGSSFGDQMAVNAAMIVAATMNGGGGRDTVVGGVGNDSLNGGVGDDTIRGGVGADVLDGGAGVDLLDYSDATTRVVVRMWNQTASGDVATGDVISGFEYVVGGSGGDAIVGSDNVANFLSGGAGNDALQGLSGYDTISGGAGADNLNGGTGVDTLDYSESNLGVVVRLWNHTATGGNATGDVIAGFERVFGGQGNDAIVGSSVANYLVGNAGDDNMQGLDGNDILFGGAGNDTLTGGAGNDRFDFVGVSGADRITDFSGGAGAGDVLRLVNFGAAFNSFAEIMAASTQVGANTVIQLGVGTGITLIGVNKSTLAADDFVFT